jgi:hypothetical protein
MNFANIFKTLSCELFAIVYSQLRLLQVHNPFIAFEEIVEAVGLAAKTINNSLTEEDLQDYAGIVFEATMRPVYLRSVGGKFGLKSELTNSEEKYFREIMKTLEEKKVLEHDVESFWTKFLKDVDIYLRGSHKVEAVPVFLNPNEMVSYNMKKTSRNEFSSYFEKSLQSFPFNREEHVLSSQPEFMQRQQQSQGLPQRTSFMKHEGIQRLMNSFRKSGVDMIFPPVIHEKVNNDSNTKNNSCFSFSFQFFSFS